MEFKLSTVIIDLFFIKYTVLHSSEHEIYSNYTIDQILKSQRNKVPYMYKYIDCVKAEDGSYSGSENIKLCTSLNKTSMVVNSQTN